MTINRCCTILIKGCKQWQQFIKQPKPQPIIGVTIMKLLSAITLEKELYCTFKNQCNIGMIERCYMLHAVTYMTVALNIFLSFVDLVHLPVKHPSLAFKTASFPLSCPVALPDQNPQFPVWKEDK